MIIIDLVVAVVLFLVIVYVVIPAFQRGFGSTPKQNDAIKELGDLAAEVTHAKEIRETADKVVHDAKEKVSKTLEKVKDIEKNL